MQENRYWVFRFPTGESGDPADSCPVDINRKEIKEYKHKVSSIDEDDEISFPDLDELIKELFKNHKLRQGWGYIFDGMNLDLDQPQQKWIENYIKLTWRIWGVNNDCEDAMGRWNILKGMKDMKKGDIIFVPRIPNETKFTVVTVKDKYYFQKMNGYNGHGHLIEVEKKIKDLKYENHFQPKVFNPYRRAIGEIKEHHQNYGIINKFIKNNY